MLPKIHKANNLSRPRVSSIGSTTEKLSAYIDEYLRPLLTRIPIYIKDTTHFLNLVIGKKNHNEEDLLVTIDVSSLYTNLPHNEGVCAINKRFNEAQTNPVKQMCLLADLPIRF